MKELLKTLLKALSDELDVSYDEAHFLNINADQMARCCDFAYIEEFTTGTYTSDTFFKFKTADTEITFGRWGELEQSAEDREAIREELEANYVLPFIDAFNNSEDFERVDSWAFENLLPRFDANEVSITLRFACRKARC